MSLPTQSELEAEIVNAMDNMSKWDGIVNGNDQASVLTDGGTVPSVAKFYNDALRNAPTTSRLTESWSALNALTGTVAGEGAVVLDADTGTHTDPVVGGTVANSGSFRWSASPAGWRRVGTTGLATKSDRSVTDLRDLFPGRSLSGVTAAELTAFAAVRKLEFSGVPEGKVMILKFLFWKDVGTRFNMTFQVADNISGTNAADACSFSLSDGQGAGSWSGFKDIELAEVSSSGIRASATLDLTGLSNLAAYNPTTVAMFQRRQVNPACFLGGGASAAEFAAEFAANLAANIATLNTSIEAQLSLAQGQKKPFADGMTNATLRRIVRGIDVFNAPDRSERYVISQFNVEQFAGTPLTRVLVDLRDTVLGAVVARYSFSTASAPTFADFWATVPEVLRLDDFTLSPAPNTTRIIAFLKIDKSAVTNWMTHSTTTIAGGGVHPDQSFPDAMQADYLEDDRAHEVIPVGAGQTFTTLRAAVESLYGEGTTVNSYRRGRAHYNRRQRIELIDDADYAATYLDFPEFVELVGQGQDRTRIVKENNDTDAMLEMHLAGKIHNLTIYSDTGDGGSWLGEYCVHWDDFNRRAGGGKAQNLRIRKSMKNVNLIGGPNQKTWLLGSGISSGEHWLIENVHAWHEADLTGASGIPAAFGIHNTGPRNSVPTILTSQKPSIVQMRGCSSRDMTTFALYVQTLAASSRCILDLQDCSFHCVRQDVAIDLNAPLAAQPDLARDRFAWAIGGKHDGAILQTDPQGLIVLQTTPGVAVSGDAAPLIFGAVDNLGRGEKWVKNGSTARSLGARLGDCSSTSKTLTIGAQSVTFTTNLTSETNTAILALINAAITTNPVTEVDIQLELYPDTGTLRQVQNSTGATIPRGVFVKFTGQDTIAVCGAGERPDGWIFRAIPDGAMGTISVGRRIATQYLTNAASATGEWGVNASGQVDYSASPKLGRTAAGVVEVYR